MCHLSVCLFVCPLSVGLSMRNFALLYVGLVQMAAKYYFVRDVIDHYETP